MTCHDKEVEGSVIRLMQQIEKAIEREAALRTEIKELQDKLAIAEEALEFFAQRERVEKELHRMKYITMHGHRAIREIAGATLDTLHGNAPDVIPHDLQKAIDEARAKVGG